MPLNKSQVAQIVVLAQERYTQRQLAERSQTSQSAVYRVLERYEETGTYTRRAGQGRKRKTSRREDYFLSLQARRKRFVTAQHLRNDLQVTTWTVISSRTVLRRLREMRE
jgi:transposase